MFLNRLTWRWLGMGLLAAVGLYFLYLVRAILPPFIFAIALTYLLSPLVDYLSQHRLNRTAAIAVVYILLGAGAVLIGLYGLPALARELSVLAEAIPRYTDMVQSLFDELQFSYRRIHLPEFVRQVVDENIRQGETLALESLRTTTNIMVGLLSQAFSLIVAPIIAFYFLQDGGGVARRIQTYAPREYREEILSLFQEIDLILHNFILGRLFIAAVVGALTTLGLALTGVDLVLVLGLIAGLSDLIPYFGPVLGAIPAVLLAGTVSTKTMIYVILVFVIVQQIESNLLAPLILGESVGLHPVLVVFALLAGGHLYGVWGVLLAVPAAAIMGVLLRFVYHRFRGFRAN